MARTYKSTLREQQAEETRLRILDATLHVLGTGIAKLSIPRVAREAGVSVPTVYRYFSSKDELIKALAEHLRSTPLFSGTVGEVSSLEELVASVPGLFGQMEGRAHGLRAMLASEVVGDVRRETWMPVRRQRADVMLERERPHLSEEQRFLLREALLLLWSSAALGALKDRQQLSTQQASDVVQFAMRALLDATESAS